MSSHGRVLTDAFGCASRDWPSQNHASHLVTLNANFHPRIIHSTRKRLDKFQNFILIAPVLLFSMVAHEYAHGYAALKQGDTTAYSLGRLTWNPIPHIDLFMTILLPLITYFTTGIAFGGAKPVPVIPRNYRNYKRGDIIVSLAGVATNFVIAALCIPLILAVGALGRAVPVAAETGSLIQTMLLYGILINLALAAFNLIPIPPLDGSALLFRILTPRQAWQVRPFLAQYGFIILLVFIFTIGQTIMPRIISAVFNFLVGR
jgi:Zn-dependent protease